MKKRYIKLLIIMLILLIVDMLTKFLLEGKSFLILKNIVSVESTHNIGAAWSILEGQMILFISGAIIFIVGLSLFDYFVKPISKIYDWAFILLIVGTLGNAIDRILFGYVRDFIKLEFINFPIFNIADSCLTIGVILFSIYILFIHQPKVIEKKVK